VTDLSGKKELRIYHPADAFEKNLRAYISSILPFLKCRMDVQATDHKGMILRYVTAYVSKFKDQQTSQALYSRHINSAMAAYRHLSDMKPLEPEMVVTLSASKPAWTNNSTKRYIPPRPNNAEDSVMIRKYIARSDDIEHLSLLMWLRTYDTSKANPTPYKRNVSLVGVKYVSVYKPDYFFQYLIVNHPFKAIQDLQHVSHNVLPNELQYFVSALVLQRELWSDDENIRTLFRQQGNKEHYVFNVIHYVDSLRQLYHLWQMEVVTNANFQITNEVAPVQLSIEQQLVFAKLKVYLRLRSRHYASLHALQFEHIPPTPTNDTDSDSDDDETINDDPATESVAQRVNIVEQQYDENDSLNDWTRIISVLGKPGTGKTQCLHGCIRYLIQEDKNVLVATPTGYLASTYRAIFDTSIDCNTIHSSFNVPIDHTPPQVNFLLANYDVIFLDEVSMVPKSIFHHILQTLQQLSTRPVVVISGDPYQQQPIETVNNRIVQTTNIYNDSIFP